MQGSLLWLDMEMTGLDPGIDRVIEVAAIVTDWDFNEIAMFESGVGHDTDLIKSLLNANGFYALRPDTKSALIKLVDMSPPEVDVDQKLAAFIDEHCTHTKKPILAGNSIHQDRRFIRHYFRETEKLLHYRMLDVSAWKVVYEAKFKSHYQKAEVHRALSDVRESIAEMKHYLERVQS